MTKENGPQHTNNRLRTGADLQAWRNRMALSAKELAKLIGVTERTIHRAEQTNKLGSKIQLGIELLQSRLAHGEIILPTAQKATSQRVPPRKEETTVVREPTPAYGSDWHGELRTGADIRLWRRSIGLYQQELAMLLQVTPHTLNRAEKSESPSAGVIYGAELLRTKLLQGAFDLDEFKKMRVHRGRPKKRGGKDM
jgi:DNA-binding XRE family transcriptional regulator